MLRTAIIAFGLAAIPLTAPHAETCQLVEKASLPLTFIDNEIAVEVQVNGTTVNFYLDTGANYSGISAALARRLGIDLKYARGDSYALGGEGNKQYVVLEEFRFGNLRSRSAGMPALDGLYDGTDGSPAGLLGVDMISNMMVEIDPLGKHVNFFEKNRCGGNSVYWNSSHFELPFQVSNGAIEIQISVQGRDLSAIIDTGADETVMDLGTARRLFGSSATDSDVADYHGGRDAEGRSLTTVTQQLQDFQFGPIKLPRKEFKLLHFPKTNEMTGSHIRFNLLPPVIIGMDFLKKLHPMIDWENNMIYFTLASERDRAPAPAATPQQP